MSRIPQPPAHIPSILMKASSKAARCHQLSLGSLLIGLKNTWLMQQYATLHLEKTLSGWVHFIYVCSYLLMILC